jgi:hypothetical protein
VPCYGQNSDDDEQLLPFPRASAAIKVAIWDDVQLGLTIQTNLSFLKKKPAVAGFSIQ